MIAIKPCCVGTQVYLFLYTKSHLIRIHTAINYLLMWLEDAGVLHPCANTQGGTGLLIAVRKGTDQTVKVIERLMSLIIVSVPR